MKQLNRYYRCAKISERKTRQIIKYFALDLTANKTAQLAAMTHQSVNRIFLKIRNRIAEEAERASPFTSCEVEVDESYFGARRVKGKRGRGAGGKTKVFGIFKRNGSVYTEIVPDCRKKTLQAVIRGRVSLDAVVHSDKWRGYDGLVDVGSSKHFRVNHSQDEFVNGEGLRLIELISSLFVSGRFFDFYRKTCFYYGRFCDKTSFNTEVLPGCLKQSITSIHN
jgi:transposase-like protein